MKEGFSLLSDLKKQAEAESHRKIIIFFPSFFQKNLFGPIFPNFGPDPDFFEQIGP